jgi:carbon-monoxide dehydrogenase iron sulfur subunit
VSGTIKVAIEKCTACKRCVLACATEKSQAEDVVAAMLSPTRARSRIQLVQLGRIAVPVNCRHCDAPACLAACPAGAIIKAGPGFPVILLENRCVGCRSCVTACPYGAIQLDERRGIPYKCDLCVKRLAAGRLPACVEACPTGCLSFESEEQKRKRLQDVHQAVAPELVSMISGV